MPVFGFLVEPVLGEIFYREMSVVCNYNVIIGMGVIDFFQKDILFINDDVGFQKPEMNSENLLCTHYKNILGVKTK